MNVWTCSLSAIEFTKIETVNAANDKKESEKWILRITPGNEFCVATDKVMVCFPNTHSAICNNSALRAAILKAADVESFDDIKVNETIKLSTGDIPEEWRNLHTEDAWNKNREFGTMALFFDVIPIDAENPKRKFCVWDVEKNKPQMNKHGLPIISTVREVASLAIWMPDSNGNGVWTSMIGTDDLDSALRAEMELILGRGTLMPLPGESNEETSTTKAKAEEAPAEADDDSGEE